MKFLKSFLINLAFLLAILLVLFIIAPEMMKQVFGIYGALFGPLAVIILLVAALPKRNRSRR